ncbi:MAG TPA: hypothetical protein VFT13_00725 [Candidatus Krumholzibacteria bacterium]|nr:hypothetical protein [Candidatus Krumholzibacteria bacterium]
MRRLRLALPPRVLRVIGWVAIAWLVVTLIPVVALRWVDPPTSAFMVARRVEGIVSPARRVPIS